MIVQMITYDQVFENMLLYRDEVEDKNRMRRSGTKDIGLPERNRAKKSELEQKENEIKAAKTYIPAKERNPDCSD